MRKAPLKRLVATLSGSGFPVHLQNDPSQELPFFKVGSLSSVDTHGFITNSSNTISRQTADDLVAELIPEESSLMAKIGAATFLGRVAQNRTTCCIDNNMMALVPRQGVDQRFVYYLLHNIDVFPLMNPGAVPNLNMTAFRHLDVAFPELSEQRLIADF